ncbi:MAG: bifunctional lysylphosphatidylglycerol flippase/synthetase MprF [Geoalkalibacter sp.]|uniref:bifunctional lysylphosphatidylglycerol flippase/synthetase MprF n=1 Tax=Geoalkalibacter sp. TaxID=3041440 RepID=UPI003D113A2A
MKKIKLRHLSPMIGLALFLLALFILNRALGESSYRDIFRHVSEFPPARIAGAIALTAASYLILTCYDHLALQYLQKRIGRVRVSLASFISYCFSRNLGFALLTGGSIRYRFYSAWGLSAEEIARLITFAAMTFLLGFLTIGGSILLVSPAALPATPLTFWAVKPLGLLALFLAGGYLLFVFVRRQPFRIRSWQLKLPSFSLSLIQLFVGSLDWVIKASVLYYLLSGTIPLSLFAFLEIYLVAQIAATISHVPGGLGVFESVVVLLLPELAATDLMATLLVHRGIYYLLPFASAVLLLGGLEALQQARTFRRAKDHLGQWLSGLAPPVFAGAVLFTGAILLFSCATPTMGDRLEWVGGSIALPLIELSHFLLALSGAGLMILARGLQRRLRSAYMATLVLLSFSIALTLLKGMTFEQAILLVLILSALIPSQSLFYRDVTLREEPFSAGWVSVIAIAFGSALWLVWISYDHQDATLGSWWSFALYDEAPRSLRAMSGAAVVLLSFSVLKLRQPKLAVPDHPDAHALATAQHIIDLQPYGAANLAMLGDKALLFTETEDAFLMFAHEGRYWVALGDPVGIRQHIPNLAWCFNDMSGGRGNVPVFYLVGEDFLSVYLDMGLALVKIGNEAIIPLKTWSGKMPEKIKTQAYRFEVLEHLDDERFATLKRLGAQWAQSERDGDCGFSQGCFDRSYMERFALAVLLADDEPAAFALILPGGAGQEEFTIDLLHFPPHNRDAAEYLLHCLAAWGRDQGFGYFNLGIIPALEDIRLQSPVLWQSLGTSAFRNGASFSSLQEMQAYFESLQPVKKPRYVAFPGEVSAAGALDAVATLIQTSRPHSGPRHT